MQHFLSIISRKPIVPGIFHDISSYLGYFKKSILFGKHSGKMSIIDVIHTVLTRFIYHGWSWQYKSLETNRKTEMKILLFRILFLVDFE